MPHPSISDDRTRRRYFHRLAALTALIALVLVSPRPTSAQVSFKTLYTFTGSSDSIVLSALIQGTDGNFYGTTSTGGAADAGTVYRMTPSGSVTVLHEFLGGSADGATPLAALIQATDGSFYGTTSAGGANNLGTVFRMTPSGSITILHAFVGGTADGATPYAALIQATDGNFYGTTIAGGSLGIGTVFRMTPSGGMALLHSFTGVTFLCNTIPGQEIPCPGEDADGSSPIAALLQAADGNFYGTTPAGGGTRPFPNARLRLNGTIFRMTPDGAVTTLRSFPAGTSGLNFLGSGPGGPLIQASDGNLYGTTRGRGLSDLGGAFRLTLDGTFSSVAGLIDATVLTQATDGNFYAVDRGIFAAGAMVGAVIRVAPSGVVTRLQATSNFQSGSSLVQAADGTLYGTLEYGTVVSGSTTTRVAPSVYQLSAGLPPPAAPGITSQPSGQTVRAGQRAVFVAAANGLPAPVYQWQVSSDHGGTWTNVINGGPYSGAGTSQLSVTPPTQAFGGYQFRAVVTNALGTATSNPASLTAQPKAVADVDGDGKTDLVVFRPQSGLWFFRTAANTTASVSLGQSGDVPVLGDYDGDGVSDLALYRPTTGTWFILMSSRNSTTPVTYQWGLSTDLPVPGDYDGDGKTDLAVYRPSTGVWYIVRSSTGSTASVTFALGVSTDIPVPADYDGDGTTDIAVWRASNAVWYIRQSSTNFTTSIVFQWGSGPRGDVPVPGDYDGDGKADLAVWLGPQRGQWDVRLSSTNFATSLFPYDWGLSTDLPVPGDYDGDGKTDIAVFRPDSGSWWIGPFFPFPRPTQWGQVGDAPAPNAPIAYARAAMNGRPTPSALASLTRFSDMDGDSKADPAVWRPSIGTWFTLQSGLSYTTATVVQSGSSGDIPAPGDYDGDGKTDLALFRPSSGIWSFITSTGSTSPVQWGTFGDIPVPGDYDGDGRTDIAVYRPSSGVWYILQSSTNFTTSAAYQWGLSTDVPIPGDYDGDGITDLAVYRPSTGAWYVVRSNPNDFTFPRTLVQWGLATDVPVPGDYDGDGKTDVAVYRPSTGAWYLLLSSAGYITSKAFQFGLSTDIPVPGDFDGDGKTDIAVWRPSTGVWSVLQSRTNFTTSSSVQWGASGDLPILRRP